jgi:hypothetical protein
VQYFVEIFRFATGRHNDFSGFAINEVHKFSDLRFAEKFLCSPLHFRQAIIIGLPEDRHHM